jgi:hypothetical protein
VQIDGCLHHWFEERGPQCTVLVYVDDATGRLMELRFVRSEPTFDVVIEYKGVALPARQFVKDARVSQGAIADNKLLGPLLAQIRQQQEERDAQTLATKRLTLRDEDLMRKGMGQVGLPTRRKRVA